MSNSTSAFSSCCFGENYSRNTDTLVENPGSAVQIATYAKTQTLSRNASIKQSKKNVENRNQ